MNILLYKMSNIPSGINNENLEMIELRITNCFYKALQDLKITNNKDLENNFLTLLKIIKGIIHNISGETLSLFLIKEYNNISFSFHIEDLNKLKYKLTKLVKGYKIEKYNKINNNIETIKLEVKNPTYETIINYFINEGEGVNEKMNMKGGFGFKLVSKNKYLEEVKRVWTQYPNNEEEFSGLYSLTDKNKQDLIKGKEIICDEETFKIDKASKREMEIYPYNYFLTENQIEFLLENEEYEVCTACSGSGRYCGRIASCCDGKGVVLKEEPRYGGRIASYCDGKGAVLKEEPRYGGEINLELTEDCLEDKNKLEDGFKEFDRNYIYKIAKTIYDNGIYGNKIEFEVKNDKKETVKIKVERRNKRDVITSYNTDYEEYLTDISNSKNNKLFTSEREDIRNIEKVINKMLYYINFDEKQGVKFDSRILNIM